MPLANERERGGYERERNEKERRDSEQASFVREREREEGTSERGTRKREEPVTKRVLCAKETDLLLNKVGFMKPCNQIVQQKT